MPDEPTGDKIGTEWFDRGEHDLQSAQILFREGGYPDTIAVLLQQAAEKYLKGYLLLQGWKLRKIHDLESLVNDATAYDKEFAQFLDIARLLSGFYIEDRYPPVSGLTYSREEMARILEETEKLVGFIRQATRQSGGT